MKLPFDIPEILKFGIIGLGTIMAILSYFLLRQEQNKPDPRNQIINSIYVFMTFAVILTIIGLWSETHKNIPKDIPNIDGQWVYICTGNNGKYQHGGRFIARQNNENWELNGERMWKDTLNGQTNKWNGMLYEPSKSWKSIWGSIDNDEIRFEYLIPNVNGEDIHGYSVGQITVDKLNRITKVKGTFHQLFPSRQISGEIEFYRVSDNEFDKPTWIKNHTLEQ